jgi:hypothetical protein
MPTGAFQFDADVSRMKKALGRMRDVRGPLETVL